MARRGPDDAQRRAELRNDVGTRVMQAALQLHYAAHVLGRDATADETTARLRGFADTLHDLGKRIKRG